VFAVEFNNQGWQAIRDLQLRAFGAYHRRVSEAQDVAGALEEPLACSRSCLCPHI
jgi:hypothetical protein